MHFVVVARKKRKIFAKNSLFFLFFYPQGWLVLCFLCFFLCRCSHDSALHYPASTYPAHVCQLALTAIAACKSTLVVGSFVTFLISYFSVEHGQVTEQAMNHDSS
jgi:hypothetical protein